jgi:hypothetical protein
MLSDTDEACVTIALALCLVHTKNRCWIKEWYYKRRPQHARTHTRTHAHTLLVLSEPKDYRILS